MKNLKKKKNKQAKDDLKRRTQNKRRKGKSKITGADFGFSTSKSTKKKSGRITGKDLGVVKEVRCTAIKKSGGRCKNTTTNKNKRCYAHQ